MMFRPNNSPCPRRSFLRSVRGTAIASLVAPTILPRLYARDSPNNRLNLAAIGVGRRGTAIGLQAASLGQMIACRDVHDTNAQNFATLLDNELSQDCKIYRDYRELLVQEPDIDAVTIGTPDHRHVKIAIEAMTARKRVYCEKPLTLTFEDGRLSNKAMQQYNKTFQVGTQQRSEFGMNFLKPSRSHTAVGWAKISPQLAR